MGGMEGRKVIRGMTIVRSEDAGWAHFTVREVGSERGSRRFSKMVVIDLVVDLVERARGASCFDDRDDPGWFSQRYCLDKVPGPFHKLV